MFRHMVIFSWAPEATPEQIAAFGHAVGPAVAQVASVTDCQHGPDAGLGSANCDYAVVVDFDDEAGYLTYRDHPAHLEFIKHHVLPTTASRAAIQFEF